MRDNAGEPDVIICNFEVIRKRETMQQGQPVVKDPPLDRQGRMFR